MSINTIETLSGFTRGGRLSTVNVAEPSGPPVDPHPDLDLDLDLDVFGTRDLFAAAGRSDAALGDGPAATLGDKDENGSGTGTAAVAASGNQGIDGLLSGVRWNGGFITYSFPDSAADYQASHPEAFTNAQQINAAQQLAAHFALNDATYTQPAAAVGFSVEGFTGLSVSWTASESAGTIRLINTDDPGTAYAYYPSSQVYGGDAFFGNSGRTPVMGNYHWHTMLHEIGHSLGLKHGQETSVYGAMPSYLDSMEYSVMTYRSYVGHPGSGGYTNEAYGYAQTYMMYDIAALQHMYGADFTTNSGNTTYAWNPGSGNTVINGNAAITPGANRIFMTVWDGGGIDTYDASAYTTGVTINLLPGGYSLLSSGQRAYLGTDSSGVAQYARGNVFNALQYNGDARSLIENATGGSGSDTLYGNNANNVLTGNAGGDYLWTSSGNDTLYGGDGNDTLYGADGNDYNTGDGGNDYIWAYTGADTAYGGEGNDTVYGGADNDWVQGDAGNDYVHGEAGNDYVFGGDGVDSMYGGDGDDWVYGGHSATIDAVADGGAGTDGLYYGYFGLNGYTFDDELEQIRLGSTVVGTMVGFETIYGGYGNDIIISDGEGHTYYGIGGNDTMIAGLGDETMYGGTGIDTIDMTLWDVSYSYNMTTGLTVGFPGELYLEFERVVMGDGNDTVIGTAGNETIDGGLGNDSMEGAAGNDTYLVNSLSDLVVELAGGGVDWINASVNNLTLAANVENLQLRGGNINGTGNALSNIINGTAGKNTLHGGSGGADTLRGYGGNDTYIVGPGDVIVEAAGKGTDTMRTWVTNTLFANVENLTLTGGGNINGTGNGLGNVINGTGGANVLNGMNGNDTLLGNAGNDALLGGGGNDRLDGGAGADNMTGNAGADSFVYRAGADRVIDFLDNVDTLLLDDSLWGGAALTVNQVLAMASVIAGDVIFNFGGGNILTVDNVANKFLLADDMVFV